MALICVELASDDVLVGVLRWALAVQDAALVSSTLSPAHRAHLHVSFPLLEISILILKNN